MKFHLIIWTYGRVSSKSKAWTWIVCRLLADDSNEPRHDCGLVRILGSISLFGSMAGFQGSRRLRPRFFWPVTAHGDDEQRHIRDVLRSVNFHHWAYYSTFNPICVFFSFFFNSPPDLLERHVCGSESGSTIESFIVRAVSDRNSSNPAFLFLLGAITDSVPFKSLISSHSGLIYIPSNTQLSNHISPFFLPIISI